MTRLLIAEDDVSVADGLVRSFARNHSVRLVRSAEETRRVLAEPAAWSGAIFDVGLPDGSGLDLLDVFRRVEPSAPALVLTGHCEPAFINRAQQRKAAYAIKPLPMASLRAFAEEVQAHAARRSRDLEVIVRELSERFALSASEHRLLELSARGVARKDLGPALEISENTVKAQIRSLLRKCNDAESLGELARTVWSRSAR